MTQPDSTTPRQITITHEGRQLAELQFTFTTIGAELAPMLLEIMKITGSLVRVDEQSRTVTFWGSPVILQAVVDVFDRATGKE